jgi:hypothetical protein
LKFPNGREQPKRWGPILCKIKLIFNVEFRRNRYNDLSAAFYHLFRKHPPEASILIKSLKRFEVFTAVTVNNMSSEMWRRVDLQPPAHAGSYIADFSILKMEVIRFFETWFYTRSTWRHIPEDDLIQDTERFERLYSNTCQHYASPNKGH